MAWTVFEVTRKWPEKQRQTVIFAGDCDIERTIEFILEKLDTASARLEKMTEQHSRIEDRQAELAAEFYERLLQPGERHERDISAVGDEWRRLIRYSVDGHKRERVRATNWRSR